MTYTPINWQTGDTITAEKMNKMDNGWAVESSSQQLFTETVTTTVDPDYPEDGAWGYFAYSTLIAADALAVTFDGTDYTCPRIDLGNDSAYGGYVNGAPDFTDFPFAILSSEFMGNINTNITTASAGTYAVSAYATSSSIETSPAFETAVNSVVDTSTMPMLCVSGTTTYAEMLAAYGAGRILFFRPRENIMQIRYVTDISAGVVTFIPADPNVTATFENDVFTVTLSV